MADPHAPFGQQPEWITSWLAKKAEVGRKERVPVVVPLAKRIQTAIDRIDAHRSTKRSNV
jgi:hypothetical protein